MASSCGPGQNGASGANGPVLTSSASVGQIGNVSTPNVSEVIQSRLNIAPNSSWLLKVFSDIQRQYLNAEERYLDASCSERLIWLQRVVNSARDVAATKAKSNADLKEFDSVTILIRGLLGNIGLGLDIYGRDQNRVNLVATEIIEKFIADRLDDLETVEHSVKVLSDAASGQSRRGEDLNKAVTALSAFDQKAKREIEALSSRIGALQDEISQGLVDLGKIWVELFRADGSFKNAVARKADSSGSCDFEGVLKAAALVTSVVATGGSAIALVGAAGAALSGVKKLNEEAQTRDDFSLSSTEKDFKQLSGLAKTVGDKADDFKNAYRSVKPALDARDPNPAPTADVPNLPSDYAKLVISKDDFEKQLAPYISMPEAQAYRSLIDKFCSVAETRNNKIIEHDASVARIFSLVAEGEARKIQTLDLAQSAEQAFDASLSSKLDYLNFQMDTMRSSITRALVDMATSIHYVTLVRPSYTYGTFDATSLRAAYGDLKDAYFAALSSVGTAPANGKNIRVPVENVLSEAEMDRFLTGEIVTICIPTNLSDDPFRFWYSVRTVSLTLEMYNSGEPVIPVIFKFEHQGRSLVFDDKRRAHVFSHNVIEGLYKRDAAGIGSDGRISDKSDRWVGVSPYGPWRAKLENIEPSNLPALRKSLLSFEITGNISSLR